ncbi:MAG: hypothetical protein A2X13_14570 [Bacteroidetes bacterium GWC2_33_15]|nr:MAG: hypothetical protein A2X10_12615 [Bacteroidetes bacterium GWA2_33_15]OFX50096.1 MAG: hypothetical protein A2X13_14570 [Bacteroidetes bacterium GWC2_33_15]OFX65249.1 MAG: hypothetical protein A2X15_04145 [Bacteroidetes bacterium GWB2_32_14]OFX70475.1 MAG: hypothetical protein A2X14_04200 [Bacteroidetes bacterium GWD2_33_33]HAN19652.1 phage Gp37/Gp68 family protein [Bacteroidales bacterium]
MTKIEWTNETWNPIIGCSKISEGCKNCYAEKMANRLAYMAIKQSNSDFLNINGIGAYTLVTLDGKWNGKTKLVPSAFKKPLEWKKPRMIFICSMGDLFHEYVPFEWIDAVFAITQKCMHHTFQVLTKRPERMLEYFKSRGITNPYLNVWLGVTTENKEEANKRIPVLLNIPAAIRFVSVEPMLSNIQLSGYTDEGYENLLTGDVFCEGMNEPTKRNKIDWVICGGESGTNARPMHPDWVESLQNQCKETNTPFFFKSWGEWAHIHVLLCNAKGIKGKKWYNIDPETALCKIGKSKTGNLIDGKEYKQFPTVK